MQPLGHWAGGQQCGRCPRRRRGLGLSDPPVLLHWHLGWLGTQALGCRDGGGIWRAWRGVQSEKETRQCLSDHPASSWEGEGLEAEMGSWRAKVWEHLEEKGPRSDTGDVTSRLSST